MLLEITSATWIVTGLGFGIVLALLFCLVFIMQFFGWTMQKMTAPRAPKAPEPAKAQPATAEPSAEEKAAIAMALTQQDDAAIAAIAYALYRNQGAAHDLPTAVIAPQARSTAWNDKSIGLNNKGF